jgi:hypothetical protein
LDRLLARRAYEGQFTSEPQDTGHPDNLFDAVAVGHRTHGRFDARARDTVVAFNATVVRIVVAIGSGAALIAAWTALLMIAA